MTKRSQSFIEEAERIVKAWLQAQEFENNLRERIIPGRLADKERLDEAYSSACLKAERDPEDLSKREEAHRIGAEREKAKQLLEQGRVALDAAEKDTRGSRQNANSWGRQSGSTRAKR